MKKSAGLQKKFAYFLRRNMAVCPVCGCTFQNIRQLGPHVRTCKRNFVAQPSGGGTTTAVATSVSAFSAPVITVPVGHQASTMHTPMSELARRRKRGDSWRRADVRFVGRRSMPAGSLAHDYREVRARNHITHQRHTTRHAQAYLHANET